MEVNVEVKQTIYNKVRLDEYAIKQVVTEYINKKYGIYYDDWIDGTSLKRSIEYYTSHSWFETEIVRSATEFDSMLLRLLKELR